MSAALDADAPPPAPAHCWHGTGVGTSLGLAGGSDGVRCCLCGSDAEWGWRFVERTQPPHGPHFRTNERVWADAPNASEPCPARPA